MCNSMCNSKLECRELEYIPLKYSKLINQIDILHDVYESSKRIDTTSDCYEKQLVLALELLDKIRPILECQ